MKEVYNLENRNTVALIHGEKVVVRILKHYCVIKILLKLKNNSVSSRVAEEIRYRGWQRTGNS